MAKAAYAAGPALLGDPALADCVIFCAALPYYKAIGPRKRRAPKRQGPQKRGAPNSVGPPKALNPHKRGAPKSAGP